MLSIRKLLWLLGISAALVAALPLLALAQTATPINYGETVSGQLEADSLTARYSFSGGRGDTVTISLASDDFDTFLTLLDSSGAELVTDDESGGEGDAQIADYTLPASGEYTIVVDSYNRLATGEYRLTLSGAALPTATPTPTPNLVFDSGLEIGSSLDSMLAPDATAMMYTFEGRAGDVVTISLTSTDFDAQLRLNAPSGVEIASDDDSAGNLNARIDTFTLPASGSYTILAGSYASGASGAFRLSLERAQGGITQATPTPTLDAPAQPTPEVLPSGSSINPYQPVGGLLSDAEPEAVYTFQGAAGQIVTISLTADDFDAYLRLLDASGLELASDDDGLGNLNARIANFVLPAAGVYSIVATSASGASSGSFELNLAVAVDQPVVTPSTDTGNTIAVGQSVSGTLSAGPASYTFAGRAGERVTITMTSEAFDAYLQLLSADGAELTSDDDSAGNLDARIENFSLPADGVYTVLAGSFDEASSGSFTLSLESGGDFQPTLIPTIEALAVPGGQIALGDTISAPLNEAEHTYTFQGEAGQLVTIRLSSEDFDTYLRLRDAAGVELVTDDDSGGSLDSQISLFALPTNGAYTVVVESFDSGFGQYSLSLQAPTLNLIEYTQTVEGLLTVDAATASYRFTGQAGDAVVIEASSGAFDTYLTLTRVGDSAALAENDDGGADTDSLIGPFNLPETGSYIVSLRSFDSTETGAYTLSLRRAELTPLAYDETVTAELTAETSALYYSFEGMAGDVVSIRVDSGGSVDTALSLKSPAGYDAASDDDGGPDFDPEINRVILDESGTYLILLTAFVPGDSGEVRLTVVPSALRSLDEGPQEVRLGEGRNEDVLSFNGVAGETVRLSADISAGAGNAPFLTVTQAGTTVATANATNTTFLVVEFTVPDDGRVTVQITDYNYASVVMTLTLERLSGE